MPGVFNSLQVKIQNNAGCGIKTGQARRFQHKPQIFAAECQMQEAAQKHNANDAFVVACINKVSQVCIGFQVCNGSRVNQADSRNQECSGTGKQRKQVKRYMLSGFSGTYCMDKMADAVQKPPVKQPEGCGCKAPHLPA